jgi:PIN domain nuclease of toxin-antitoxin system
MKFIIDTHVLLWIANDDFRLSKNVKDIYLKPENEIILSIASIWEMAIKISIKKFKLQNSLAEFVERHIIDNNIRILKIELDHLFLLENLPLHHRDPFDRLIVAQAKIEKAPIISTDIFFYRYAVKRIW